MSICVMYADGSDVRQVTWDHFDINASWHPDGQGVLFNRVQAADSPASQPAAIMTMRIGDQRPRLFTDRVAGWYASAVWHPDGSSVAVASNAFGPTMEVCIMDPRGELLRRVTNTTDGISGTHLDWSPNGASILFGAFRSGQSDTYAIYSSGDDEVRLTDDESRIQSGAKWSPDGTRTVYHSTPVGEFDDVISESELYVVDADGQNEIQLTSSPHSNAHPDW